MSREKVLLRKSRDRPFDNAEKAAVKNISREIDEMEVALRKGHFRLGM